MVGAASCAAAAADEGNLHCCQIEDPNRLTYPDAAAAAAAAVAAAVAAVAAAVAAAAVVVAPATAAAPVIFFQLQKSSVQPQVFLDAALSVAAAAAAHTEVLAVSFQTPMFSFPLPTLPTAISATLAAAAAAPPAFSQVRAAAP